MDKECPVCLGQAARLKEWDYGDKQRVDCRRCGLFEISRSALAMLDGRLSKDYLARARLSHAIRINTSDKNRLFITSANLDELAKQPLPGIPQQLEYLVRWLAGHLGEDRFGRVPNPWPEMLAGIIGTADGDRVKKLIEYGVKQGIIEHNLDEFTLGLSPKGWEMIEPSQPREEPKPQPVMAAVSSKIVKAHCDKCGGERDAFNRATHTGKGQDGILSWSETYEILECCGCHGLSVRREFWFSEWDDFDSDPLTGKLQRIPGIKVTYWPPQTKRKKPEWSENLGDTVLRNIIDEIYQALNSGLMVLASIGTRTLLDRAMFLRVEDPAGGFDGKLKAMVQAGYIGDGEKKILEIMTDAGSASAHRGFTPEAETLNTIIETVENFLQREFVLKRAAEKVKAITPPRGANTKTKEIGTKK